MGAPRQELPLIEAGGCSRSQRTKSPEQRGPRETRLLAPKPGRAVGTAVSSGAGSPSPRGADDPPSWGLLRLRCKQFLQQNTLKTSPHTHPWGFQGKGEDSPVRAVSSRPLSSPRPAATSVHSPGVLAPVPYIQLPGKSRQLCPHRTAAHFAPCLEAQRPLPAECCSLPAPSLSRGCSSAQSSFEKATRAQAISSRTSHPPTGL